LQKKVAIAMALTANSISIDNASPNAPRKMLVATAICARRHFGVSSLGADIET
jgi:hypothetical protein